MFVPDFLYANLTRVWKTACYDVDMHELVKIFRQHVTEVAADPAFLHHKWFVRWHLEVVQRIANELCEHYPEVDRYFIELLVWLHDYGKILDFEHEYTMSDASRKKLTEIGFSTDVIERAVSYIEILDKKLEVDLHTAPIEVQIVSSADGCAHMTGPFMYVFWHEATDKTFPNKTLDELMTLNLKKLHKDWDYKIVLPEARDAFKDRYTYLCQQAGELPAKFLS